MWVISEDGSIVNVTPHFSIDNNTNYDFPVAEAMGSGTVEFKVKTELLCSTAADVEKSVGIMKDRINTISDRVKGTSCYWEGDTSDDRRAKFVAKYDEISQAMNRLLTYTQTLQTISSNYENAEEENTESTQSLPIDVIS